MFTFKTRFIIFICLLPFLAVLKDVSLMVFYPSFFTDLATFESVSGDIFVSFLSSLICLVITYFSAIKKPGTGWLSFSIFCYGLDLARQFFSLFIFPAFIVLTGGSHIYMTKLAQKIAKQYHLETVGDLRGFVIYKAVVTFIACIVLIYFILGMIKLRRMNFLAQYKKTLKITSYRDAYKRISRASNANELKEVVIDVTPLHPEISKFIKMKKKQWMRKNLHSHESQSILNRALRYV